MSTTTEALEPKHPNDDEPTIVETLEEAAFILEEAPDAAVPIRPKSVQL